MDRLLVAAGTLIVVLAVADIFFTVLFPASRHGPVRKPLSQGIWRLFRLAGRMTGGRTRRNLLSYSGPTVIAVTMIVWFLLLVSGFAMVYKPVLGTAITAAQGPTDTGWATAFYYSGFTLTTLGIGDVVATSDGYRLIGVLEAALGFAYFSMAITYFLSVYSNLTGRNAFALGLHHLTGKTGDAAQLLARLADGGDLASARQHLSSKAAFLRQTYQEHLFYPVLRHFHYREPCYALPRILLIALETSALLRSALDRDGNATIIDSSALDEMHEGALALLGALVPNAEQRSPDPEEVDAWRSRYDEAREVMRAAGIDVRHDADAGRRDYVAQRVRWDAKLHALADVLLYEWDLVTYERQDEG